MNEQEWVRTMHYYFSAVLQLRQDLRQRAQKKLLELGYGDITLEMSQVLYHLKFETNGEANQQEIADKIGKNKSSLTSLLDNLIKREMVERRMNPENRRNNIISLSSKGEQFMHHFYPKLYKTYDIRKLNLGLEDIRKLTDTLTAIINI